MEQNLSSILELGDIMKTFNHSSYYILLLAIFSLCCRNAEPRFDPNVTLHFETPRHPSISSQTVDKLDSCVLRFLTAFANDTVRITVGDKKVGNVVATTNYSIAYATSFSIKKKPDTEIQIEIDGNSFFFFVRSDYVFIDLYYRKDTGKLEVRYSNNILVLS